MSEQDDGGPAFPRQELNDDGSLCHSHMGMSLRDWFAGQSLIAVYSGHKTRVDIARWSYAMADAMLRERAKREGQEP